MDTSHSVWFYVDFGISSKTEFKFVGRQAFASIKHGFFQVWGKCLPQAFPTPLGVTVLECPAISLDTVGFGYIDRCYCQLLIIMFERMADVNANLFIVADVLATIVHVWWNWHEARCYGLDFLWLMLLSLVYLFGDRCCCHFWGWILFDRCYSQCWTFQLLQGHLPWLMLLPLGSY